MAIGKISGVMLQSNLERQGVDLSVDTDLAYFDVANRRIAVNTTIATSTLTVNGNISSTYFVGNISNTTNANIYLVPTGTGIVAVAGTRAFALPSGNTAQEPTGVPAGSIRYNTDTGTPEYYSGTTWIPITSAIAYQSITPTGANASYTLDQVATTGGVLVTLNGVQQSPGAAYTVTNNIITFTETPLATDIIDVRFIAPGQTFGMKVVANIVPSTSTSAGVAGQVTYNSNYVYICVDTNTWIRANIQSTF